MNDDEANTYEIVSVLQNTELFCTAPVAAEMAMRFGSK